MARVEWSVRALLALECLDNEDQKKVKDAVDVTLSKREGGSYAVCTIYKREVEGIHVYYKKTDYGIRVVDFRLPEQEH